MKVLLKNEKRRVERNVKRARDAGCRADLSDVQWGYLVGHYNARCAYCGGAMETMDHIVPLANGGGTTFANVTPCCLSCNEAKGTAVWLPAQAGAEAMVKW